MYHEYGEVMNYSEVTFFEEREGPRLIQQKTGGVALSSTWRFLCTGAEIGSRPS